MPINNITVKPNQTLKDFSYGRRFVRGIASRSIAPLILLEAFVEGGRTYQAYQRGGFDEARERITEEMIGAAFWFSGVAGFNKLIDKFIGKKLYKLPETDFDGAGDTLRDPIQNYLKKYADKFKDPKKAEKMIAKFKFGKAISSIILANCLVGFAVPKLNQAITKHLRKNRKEEPQKNHTKQVQTAAVKMNDFLDGNHKDKNVSFGMSPQLLLSLANSFENTPKYQLLSTDVGIAGGRAICARNNHERTEVLFRDIASSFFYMFNMPIVAALLNKIQDGKSTRLDPVAAKQVSDHLEAVLDAHNGSMKASAFKEFVLGKPENKYMITPDLAKDLAKNNNVIEVENFITHLKKIVPENQFSDYEKAARKMSELQPKVTGKSMLSKAQVEDIFKDGAVNMPEFLKNVYRCATQDENLFTGKVHAPAFDNELKFISRDAFTRKQAEIADYVNIILKKAKDGDVTKDLIKKVCRENFIKNTCNWGVGFAISAAFLSTFIPKIQYWITTRVTGKNTFPGTEDYSNEKKKS